jgi:hypothetical protein
MPTLFGRGRAAFTVPVPRPEDPEPYDRRSLEVTAGAVFAALPARVTPNRKKFSDLLADFDADPQKLAARRRGPAVGSGVAIPDLAHYVLPAVAWVLGVVGTQVTGHAADALTDAVRRKAAILLGRLRQRGARPREEPAAAVEPRPAWTDEERTAFVTAFQILFVQRLGLGADPAEVLARAVAAALEDAPERGTER